MSRATRRGVMGSMAALIPTMATVPAAAAAEPDAELIAACTRFCALERTWRAASLAADRTPRTHPDYARMEAEADRLQDEQRPRVDEIVAMPCTTLAGARALAEALAEWDQELFNPRLTDADAVLTAHLVRAVLAMNPEAAG